MNPIKVGLIGCGHPHSGGHFTTFKIMPEVAAIHLCDPDPAAAEKLRQAAPDRVEAIHGSLEALLAREDVKAVAICLPNDETPGAIAAAARAGKHILCEKPCAVSAGAFEPAFQAVRQAGVGFTAYYVNRYNPAALEIHAMLQRGEIGCPLAAEMRLITTQPKFRNPQHWLFNRKKAGGGIMMWIGCHYIDLLTWWLGEPVVSVAGHCAHRTDAPIEVEDTASLSLKFQSGLLATVHFGYLLASGTAGYVGASYDTYVGMKGSDGSFAWSPHGAPQQLVRVETAGTRKEIPFPLLPSPAYGGYYGERFVRDFLRMAVDKQPAPLLPTAADASRLLRLCDAAYASSTSGHAAKPVE